MGKHVIKEVMNHFKEERTNNNHINRHSYFVPRHDDAGDEAPSDFKEIRRRAPNPKNVMEIKNFHRSQDYTTLRDKMISQGKLFRDDRFPADNSLLSDNVQGGNNYIMSYNGRMRVRPTEIKWLRPREIARDPQGVPRQARGEQRESARGRERGSPQDTSPRTGKRGPRTR